MQPKPGQIWKNNREAQKWFVVGVDGDGFVHVERADDPKKRLKLAVERFAAGQWLGGGIAPNEFATDYVLIEDTHEAAATREP